MILGEANRSDCQCGEATGESCGATGDRWVDYCPVQNAATATAARSWVGLTTRLWVARDCDEMLRTLWNDDADPTTYPDAYAYAAARDARA